MIKSDSRKVGDVKTKKIAPKPGAYANQVISRNDSEIGNFVKTQSNSDTCKMRE